MGIEAWHWAAVVFNVERHTKELYPNDPKKANALANELLALSNTFDCEDEPVSAAETLPEIVNNKKSIPQKKHWLWNFFRIE